MLNPKYFLITASILIFGAASAHAAVEILRDSYGNIKFMNQRNARNACPVGMHLPTIRELAKESQARGAKGILEVNDVNPDEVPEGYHIMAVIDYPYGQNDKFYFSNEGYKRPDDDLGKYFFWSSSFISGVSNYVGVLDFRNGDVGMGLAGRVVNPVLCVSDH